MPGPGSRPGTQTSPTPSDKEKQMGTPDPWRQVKDANADVRDARDDEEAEDARSVRNWAKDQIIANRQQ